MANSLVSGSVTSTSKGKRPRGRPRKSTQLNGEDATGNQATEPSLRATNNNDAKSQVSARSGLPGGEEAEDHDGDDDEDDLADAIPLSLQEAQRRDEEIAREERRKDRLYQALTPEQQDRYVMWGRAKFGKAAMRKIVNQTVSQSVTANPLIAINIYSKGFAGEIIMRACEVQKEWAVARDGAVIREKKERAEYREGKEKKLAELRAMNASHGTVKEGEPPVDHRAIAVEINTLSTELHRLRDEEKRMPIANEHRGGLLPDHVREALRRYKGDGEGGGVGFAGMSNHLIGVPGSGTWRVGQGLGGRRLFR
jgi:transcription initiation factor TFIID subunit 11